jgi:hypothetical protein
MARFGLVLSRAIMLTCVSALTVVITQAQSASVGDDNSTPIEGIGHDYLHTLSETVNPLTALSAYEFNCRQRKGGESRYLSR